MADNRKNIYLLKKHHNILNKLENFNLSKFVQNKLEKMAEEQEEYEQCFTNFMQKIFFLEEKHEIDLQKLVHCFYDFTETNYPNVFFEHFPTDEELGL